MKDDYNGIKAVAYARFSSDMQRHESIDAQLRAIREYAARNNILIVGEYIDRAKTATNDQRPQFLQMVKDSKDNRFSLVIIHKLDRFSRNSYDLAAYRHKLSQNGVSLRSVTEVFDDSPAGNLLLQVVGGVNAFFSENLRLETMKGLKENAYNCKHTGGTPPLGYDVDPETKKLVLNELEAEAVKIIFARYLDGYTYNEIVVELNRSGYKTKCGKTYVTNSLNSILQNEKYAGVTLSGIRFRKTKTANAVGAAKKMMRTLSESKTAVR